jgi:hypothetical protein
MEAGPLLNNQTIVDIGLELTDAYWNTHAGTKYLFLTVYLVPANEQTDRHWARSLCVSHLTALQVKAT